MTQVENTASLLDALSRILLTAFCLGIFLLLVWFGVFLLGGDFVYALHGALFKISRAQFDAIHYAGMAFTKILIFVLFLFPYVAIRWTLRKRGGAA
jgi:hypothetical protein